jgi:hypothetical protein
VVVPVRQNVPVASLREHLTARDDVISINYDHRTSRSMCLVKFHGLVHSKELRAYIRKLVDYYHITPVSHPGTAGRNEGR